jgi:hypothetical protein
MANPSIYNELARSLPVLMGGFLGVLGTLLVQMFTHRLTLARDKENLRRERIESFVKSLFAGEHWIHEKLDAEVFRLQEDTKPSPFDEARMLQVLHFPNLGAELTKILDTQLEMRKFISAQRLARLVDQTAWLKTWDPKPFYDAYSRLHHLINSIVSECRNMLDQ